MIIKIEELYDSIINSLSNFKILEEDRIKDYNSKVDKINEEIKYFGNHVDKLEKLNWFNDTVELNKIRNNTIELYRLLNKSIKLTSKPNWYYPSKEEFPEDMMDVIIIKSEYGTTFPDIMYYYGETEHPYWIEYVKAWTYLPKFEE